MTRFLKQSGLLTVAFATVFLWQHSPLSQYTIQALAAAVLLYLVISARRKNHERFQFLGKDDFISIYFLTSICLLLVFATGVLNSNLFFLLYFLCFGIGFVFEPAMVFVFVALTVLIFFESAISDDVFGNFIRLGSIALISPLAFFFGREFNKDEQEEEKKHQAKDKLEADIDDV